MAAVQSQVNGGEAARQLSDAHRQLLNDNSIQFDLPTADSYPSPQQGPSDYNPPPGYTPPLDPSAAPPAAPPAPIDLPPPGGSGGGVNGSMHLFLWIAAAIALAILLYWLVTFFRDRALGDRDGKAKKERRGRNGEETWRPGEEQAVQLLDEADMLATLGRYDEAARLLLHRSIGEIGAHRPDLVRPALTSRDIARHPLLPAGPAAAFARIAALVERSLFARRPLGAEDWQDCRLAYREFAFPEGWQG
jgi:hypothetical protein